MPPEPKVSRDDLHDILENKCRQNVSQSRIIVTVGSLQSDLVLNKNIDVTRKTIREKGICPAGYFQKKYPVSVSYKTDGSPEKRGMVIQPKQFLLEAEIFEDREELAENFEEIEVCDNCEELCAEWFESEATDKKICESCEEEIQEEFGKAVAEGIEKYIEEKVSGNEED